ncbi:MAG: class I SAM-dependent methyltransferase [Chloroflexi bacterium]|nr:class I SAM-dependent methyltransferase [Chloroflexota bacterium]
MLTNSTNLEEYADPIIYDLENNKFEPDGPFYLALAHRFGGPVLEIGCGTGRITLPLARHEIDITGLDIAPQMLARAKHKAQDVAVQWVETDARTFHLGRQFSFIFESGATFQHLLERADQEAMLARVREHLEPEGRFVVSALFPHADFLTNEDAEQDWFSYLNEQGQEVRVSGTQHYDPLRQIKTETAYRRWRDSEGREIVRPAPLMLRYTFPQEMEALLHYNGFTILERYGNRDFSPLTSESKHMIYVCRRSD